LTLRNTTDRLEAIAGFQRYTVADVAPLFNISTEYFRHCLKASKDEAFRKERHISPGLLSSLPLRHWEKIGRNWLIKESALRPQMH
jgi:hypothetical protein